MGFFLEKLAHFFLPPQCYCCGDFLEEGQRGICLDCLSGVHWIEPPFCTVCGIPFLSAETENHPCGGCLREEKYFTAARALGYYEGSLQEVIHRWKYEEKTHLTSLMGQWMVEGLNRYWGASCFSLLIPVPLHVQRLRERGFNQALLLAKELSHWTGIPYEKRALQKKKPTSPLVSLSGREREREVKGVFFAAEKEKLEGKAILLVDDVYTTGATANECSKVLLAAGAKSVDVLTLARTVRNSRPGQ